jgi:hypothetical protein
MIVARIMGGLGNQMFQYAAARRLAHVRKTELRLDIEYFAAQSKRRYALDGWRIAGAIASPQELSFFLPRKRGQRMLNLLRARWRGEPAPTILREQHFHFQPGVLSAPDNTYLDGYWQSEKYFADLAETLRAEFTPANPLSARAKELAADIAARDSISVHVRRGDYVQEAGVREIHGVCPLEYYQESVRRLAETVSEPHCYVFSDDPAWVEIHLRLDVPCTVIAPESAGGEIVDLHLMSRCRHHIIANSSFSWWAAWLNPSPQKRVLAPARWFADAAGRDTRDLLPPSWEPVAAPELQLTA